MATDIIQDREALAAAAPRLHRVHDVSERQLVAGRLLAVALWLLSAVPLCGVIAAAAAVKGVRVRCLLCIVVARRRSHSIVGEMHELHVI